MSNIPKARGELDEAIAMVKQAMKHIRSAARQMTRKSPIKRAPSMRMETTPAQRNRVMFLHTSTNMTQGQIMQDVGLRNVRQVSEIINGKKVKRKKKPL